MKSATHYPESLEYFKNNDFPTLDTSNPVEDRVFQQANPDVEGKPIEKDSGNQERELQLETWMSDIKAFIRNIDVSKL
jgi:hypothetical protein